VADTLPCLRCKYDLRGLHADGLCPECGLELLDSIAARIDPEIAALLPLRRPKTAAWSLLVLMLALTTAVVTEVVSHASVLITTLPPGSWHTRLSEFLPSTLVVRLVALPPLALALALVSAAVLIIAIKPRALVRVGLLAGIAGWLAASFAGASNFGLAPAGPPAAVTLLALSPLLADLGRWSRNYRASPAGRQRIGPLESAILLGVATYLAAELLEPWVGYDATTALRLVSAACLAMTIIGFFYLLGNAFWVWRALAWWQPLLERVIDREPAAAAAGPTPVPEPVK